MALPSGGTPVTKETFHAWLKMRKVRRDKERKQKNADASKRKKGGVLTGAQLFAKNKNIFVDDEAGAGTTSSSLGASGAAARCFRLPTRLGGEEGRCPWLGPAREASLFLRGAARGAGKARCLPAVRDAGGICCCHQHHPTGRAAHQRQPAPLTPRRMRARMQASPPSGCSLRTHSLRRTQRARAVPRCA